MEKIMVDYLKILWEGQSNIPNNGDTTLWTSFFKSEAQKAKRDEFIEFNIFFLYLFNDIKQAKENIKWQYEQRISEFGMILSHCYVSISEGKTTDEQGNPIQEKIKAFEDAAKFVRNEGYKMNDDYKYNLFKNDNTYSNTRNLNAFFVDIKQFTYRKLELIESAIKQAEQELSEIENQKKQMVFSESKKNNNDNTSPPAAHQQTFTLSLNPAQQETLYNELIKGDFLADTTDFDHFCYVFGNTPIPNDKKPFEPLQWIKTISVTKKINPNKLALLNLLALLDIPEKELINRNLINVFFHILNGKKFKANNYSYKNGHLKTQSEYHNELVEIIRKTKEK
ncbi:MAG: hypothetical protein LBT27_06520 [Prevotellaceae bacterium]|jgi:hypothetical protein|nr:hypothetical protein [Prevotellaceae bacterium]